MSKPKLTVTAGELYIRVDFRRAGKSYGVAAEKAFDDGTRTSYPYDSYEVQPGETFELEDGADLVQVKVYKPTGEPMDTSTAG